MKTLIKLTMDYADAPIWVNPSFIASMTSAKSGSALFIAMDNNPCFVRESPEEIIKMIQSANGMD